jgi:tetratricopeptide (TPR) repeat protein
VKPTPLLLLLLLPGGAARAQPERSSAGYRAFERAGREFAARDLQASFGSVEEALRQDPKLVPALTLKARIAIALNRFDVAGNTLEKAVSIEPENWYPRFLLGFQFYLQSRLQPAVEALREAQRLNPKDPKPPLYLALSLESMGAIEQATDRYREAVRNEDASPAPQAETYLSYARLLLRLGRLEECGRLIGRARQLEPKSRDVAYERARLLLRLGDASAAAREGERSLKLPPGGIGEYPIRYLLVRAWMAAGDEKRAAEHAAIIRKLEEAERKPS